MPPRRLEAVVFDLYGTLVRVGRPVFRRGVPRRLGVGGRPWMRLVRDELLARAFAGPAELAAFIVERLAGDAPRRDELVAACRALLDEELASVEPIEGALPLLAFLKRRGLRIGLVSNLTSAHKEPVARLGLDRFLDATYFSCDEGRTKPDPEVFRTIRRRLGVAPEASLVIGDAPRSDVEGARAAGLRALRVGGPLPAPSVAELGFWDLDALRPLVEPGARLALGDGRARLGALAPLPDAEQGRYNLIATAPTDAGPVFVKRFLFPEAAYVEELAHGVLADVGLPSLDATVVPGPEPCLVVARAPGEKFAHRVDAPLAFEIGRHAAAAYLFANADFRPRNAFVAYDGTRPRMTLVDLEHCFFNLAIDVEGLDDPFDPACLDALSPDELAARVRRRVLTEKTTRRAMRSFVELDTPLDEIGRAFRDGWIALFETVRARFGAVRRRIEERIGRRPFLVVGTQGYRRALARIDVDDIESRVREDPEELFPRLAALKAKPSRTRGGGGEDR